MKKKILLVNWDCYPSITSGGVYTWTKILIDSLNDWDFVVVNQLSNPNSNGKYNIPNNVIQVIEIPLFGTNRYEEFFDDGRSLYKKILLTKESVIKEHFIPIYRKFLSNILKEQCDTKKISDNVYELHKILRTYDSKKCFEHPLTWQTFLDIIQIDPIYKDMSLKEAHTAFHLLSRNLQILSINLPKVDLVHCSLAWTPSFLAIIAKKEHNSPVLITEHGVAFRELVLYYNGYLEDYPTKIFWKIMASNIVKTIYHIADLITPVCNFNATWEKRLGVTNEKIQVIYNGINIDKFSPKKIAKLDKRPTVVFVGRLEIFKDIICLLQAINYVRKDIPDVKCLIYGSSRDLNYSTNCLNALKELELENHVSFMGSTDKPEDAYNMADVIAMSSLSEGFPFSVIEAMACGKPIVSSDVGGVRESLENCGILVGSRRPKEFAKALITLLNDEGLRNKLGRLAVHKVHQEFTFGKSVEQYRKVYEQLTQKNVEKNSKTKIEVITV